MTPTRRRDHGIVKLTPTHVRVIRAYAAEHPEITLAQHGRAFAAACGVSPATIEAVIRRDSWGHL
jgi:DNA-binding MurR/RpiR family transcriptional regulator